MDRYQCLNGMTEEEVALQKRLPLEPKDRILFSHYDHKCIYEGVVTDVQVKKAFVTIEMPKKRVPEKKTDSKQERLTLSLHLYKNLEEYELISLFRPSEPPAISRGQYLNPQCTDLWLQLDDVVRIFKQGGQIDTKNEEVDAETLEVRVRSITSHSCYIVALNDSGTSAEWVPRNTLRFRHYIKRSNLAKQNLNLTFQPAN